MINLVESLNYKCLRDMSLELDSFHVLVGPNASGKTTFLDAVGFLGDLVSHGLEKAVYDRAPNPTELLSRHEGETLELAVEAVIPDDRRQHLESPDYERVRYEVEIALRDEVALRSEAVLLLRSEPVCKPQGRQLDMFPAPRPFRETIRRTGRKGTKRVVSKVSGGRDNFYDERGKGWDYSFDLGSRVSALGNLPEDETKFPVTIWLKRLLKEGIQRLALNSYAMRRPSPPGLPKGFLADGSNLPWVIQQLRDSHPDRFRDWLAHVQTALTDVTDIITVEREEDRHRYLRVCYGDLKVPSWLVSDGTLRLLALTLIAYLPAVSSVYLIEEPENGIHPAAVETVYQSLSSVYDSQVLLATHSPVILGLAEPRQVLCFSRAGDGVTDIVRGSEHPRLRNWQRETPLSELFAAGVLG